jgi:hypothetical protein
VRLHPATGTVIGPSLVMFTVSTIAPLALPRVARDDE